MDTEPKLALPTCATCQAASFGALACQSLSTRLSIVFGSTLRTLPLPRAASVGSICCLKRLSSRTGRKYWAVGHGGPRLRAVRFAR